MVLGQLLGFVALVVTTVFDKELHKYSLRVGFSMRSSRAKKFYLFFVLLGLLIIMMLFYGEFRFDWTMPQNWVVNTNNLKDPNCAKRFKEDANNKMGLT